MRVFISYSSKNRDAAEFIAIQLTTRTVSVFVDYESLQVGDNFPERLADEIDRCDVVIFLVSADSVSSKWVRSELLRAFNQDKPILPMRIDDATLPPALFFLDGAHMIDCADWGDQAHSSVVINRLCSALGLTQTAITPQAEDKPYGVLNPSAVGYLCASNLLPAPFAWLEIPGTKGKKWRGEPFRIAKYPVTNAQFAKFLEADGYNTSQWWTAEGWQRREEEQWLQPRYWEKIRTTHLEEPIVGISWFEAVAYCFWLSDITGEQIMLPTDDQWLYAAQGDDKRTYPWGNKWDSSRCNNNVDGKGRSNRSGVRRYEGKGDSPFGVVDMAGNVWEWCLTSYGTKSNELSQTENKRVVRGGSWGEQFSSNFTVMYRYAVNSSSRLNTVGFRCISSN